MLLDPLLIISNNPLVDTINNISIKKVEGSPIQVLSAVMNQLVEGYHLLSHPLAGSLKPNQNPYRSVLLAKKTGAVDLPSLTILHLAMMKNEEMLNESWAYDLSNRYADDYQLVDYTLIKNAVDSMIERGEE